jgi:hypothetical protein
MDISLHGRHLQEKSLVHMKICLHYGLFMTHFIQFNDTISSWRKEC